MIERLRARKEWQFFAVLPKADRALAAGWWTVLVLRGALPAVFAIAMGALVAAIQRNDPLAGTLAFVGGVFILLQVLTPIHQAASANLGDRTSAWLYDRLTAACIGPPGMGHLEDATLGADLVVARDFDLGMTGPPLAIALDFIAGSLVTTVGGVACAIVLSAYTWWAPIVLAGAWIATHWLLRESAVWQDRNTTPVRAAQRDAEYAYRLAVDPSPAKELRLFGLADWTLARFTARRTLLHTLQYEATRLRQRPLLWSVLLVTAANVGVFWALARSAASGSVSLGEAVVFAQVAAGTSMIAFGGLNWALDGAAAPVAAVLRLEAAMAPAGALPSGARSPSDMPVRDIRFRDVTFAYPGGAVVLEHFDLTIPAGTSLAIVGQNGAGKTTLAKLLCRLYDPQAGRIEVDGVDLRELSLAGWRERLAAVFQDFIRFELTLRDNVAPAGAPDTAVRAALEEAGAARSGGSRHDPRARVRRRHGSLRRPVATRRARAGALRRPCGRSRCPARRADGAARRARRGGDLRSDPQGHPPLHHDPDFAPLLHRPPRRPHLRARARPRRRTRHPRRADGAGRPLPDDVRAAGAAIHRGR